MPKLTVNSPVESVELHFTDQGSGDPVVLIHGWPLSGRSWENQVPALVAAGYRVITYDRRGFGESSQPWNSYNYDTLAADLDTLMTALELNDATLVGFSMGGGEVARYIGTYGTDRVARAVFAAAVPPYLYKTGDNPDGGLDDETIKSFQEGVATDRLAFLEGFIENFFAAGGKSDLVSQAQKDYARQIAAFASPKATLECIASFGTTDFRPDVAKIDVPTLVIHGDSDSIVPFEVSGKRVAETVPGARAHVIKGGPHGINATHATEFNEALLEFLGA
ncbi:alpha/beta fold hydrolase [Kineosporia succinea]|uniref:Pimeloyl-ACP methyl ester carboxylesterase n=1 Tax=Kineosporia succinea TaxID=84632 RepID=A0ABT9P0C9_9ACTN|nr:alpha/beta hydrolase [Kineosporia succinea]MDP9826128.1 pimeloyl-ACP methyl ester carboxylesterase [Kineosporia succinea]